jgi:density-regulated protein DRP1
MLLLILFPGIDLKTAARFFSSRFACGSSVTGVDEIVIQGDVKDELIDIIPEKWVHKFICYIFL